MPCRRGPASSYRRRRPSHGGTRREHRGEDASHPADIGRGRLGVGKQPERSRWLQIREVGEGRTKRTELVHEIGASVAGGDVIGQGSVGGRIAIV
jgi:hypothetical protein